MLPTDPRTHRDAVLVRSGKELEEVVAYVERNPVNAGLVDSAERWLWPSAPFRADDTNRSSAPREPP